MQLPLLPLRDVLSQMLPIAPDTGPGLANVSNNLHLRKSSHLLIDQSKQIVKEIRGDSQESLCSF